MLSQWFQKYERRIFPLLAIGQCAPLLFTDAFPSVDGPAHLAISYMWAHWPGPLRELFSPVFEARPGLYPNLLCYLVLRVLVLLMDPLVAERLFIAATIAAYPLAMRYAATRFGCQSGLAAYMALPLAYNATVFWGFYNFHWGLIAFLVFAGFMFARRRQFSYGTIALGLAIAAFMFIAHLSAVALAVVAAASVGVGDLWSDLRARRPDAWRRYLKMILWTLAVLGPAVVLILLYLGGPSAQGVPVANTGNLADKASILLMGLAMIGTPDVNWILAFITTAALGATVVAFSRRFRTSDAAVVGLAVGLALLYFAAPTQVKVRYIEVRLAGYVLSGAVLLTAAALGSGRRGLSARAATIFAAIFIALSLAGSTIRCSQFAELNSYLTEYRSAATFIRPGSTVIGLRLESNADGPGPAYLAERYLRQGESYFTVQCNAIDAKLFQAQTAVVPIQFRYDRNPYRVWATDADFTAPIPTPDLLSFDSKMGIPLEYVLVWGALERASGDAAVRLKSQLSKGFELVYQSRPSGLARLYRRRAGRSRVRISYESRSSNLNKLGAADFGGASADNDITVPQVSMRSPTL